MSKMKEFSEAVAGYAVAAANEAGLYEPVQVFVAFHPFADTALEFADAASGESVARSWTLDLKGDPLPESMSFEDDEVAEVTEDEDVEEISEDEDAEEITEDEGVEDGPSEPMFGKDFYFSHAPSEPEEDEDCAPKPWAEMTIVATAYDSEGREVDLSSDIAEDCVDWILENHGIEEIEIFAEE